MKKTLSIALLFLSVMTIAFGQRDYQIHKRGMLRETIYNTGEIGRAYDCNHATAEEGKPSMEWPGNSALTVDGVPYAGYYNSFGGGLWLSADTGRYGNTKLYQCKYAIAVGDTQLGPVQCGALANNTGQGMACVDISSFPISITRTENYPLNADGSINLGYNPSEAEEKIVAQWDTPLGITVKQTSRSWSYPDYDDFIIYEYELENTGNQLPSGASLDTLREMVIAWNYGFCPSMVGWMKKTGQWNEADMRRNDMYARFDFKRYLTYNHTRDGMPYNDMLLSPGATGIMMLYYDYAHLSTRTQTNFYVDLAREDSLFVWDSNQKMKQPYLNRYENGGLYPSKIGPVLDGKVARKTSPFNPKYNPTVDSAAGPYWYGRTKPSLTLGNMQPVSHEYGFGPYFLPPHEKMYFAIAEVVGYGPGIASDSIYSDIGGGGGTGTGETGNYMHPVPSWYNTMWYPAMNMDPYATMGSKYLQTYPLPAFVNSNVISLRDVADRAIQMYKGGSVIKYDTLQYEPLDSPFPGTYNTPSIVCPAPIIHIKTTYSDTVTFAVINTLTWDTSAESFSTPRLQAPLQYFLVLRGTSAIGPWIVVDSVVTQSSTHFHDFLYTVIDSSIFSGESYYYSVISVNSLGGKSGMTNMVKQLSTPTNVPSIDYSRPYKNTLSQNYPNPFNPATTIKYEITKRGFVSLTVFDILGRKVKSLVDNIENPGPHEVIFNAEALSSGVYFYRLTAGDYCATKKFILMK